MIQRIQTIYLLLAAVAAFLLFILPFAQTNTATAMGIFQDNFYTIFDNIALLGLFVGAGVMALIAIFLFKNRPLQLRIGLLSLFLTIAGTGVAIFLFFQNQTENATAVKEGFGLGMPVFSSIFTLLAQRAIRKDERLVRSADRLR
jgi:peptidoglycan/LPS O-acetylase OafA/YrhL